MVGCPGSACTTREDLGTRVRPWRLRVPPHPVAPLQTSTRRAHSGLALRENHVRDLGLLTRLRSSQVQGGKYPCALAKLARARRQLPSALAKLARARRQLPSALAKLAGARGCYPSGQEAHSRKSGVRAVAAAYFDAWPLFLKRPTRVSPSGGRLERSDRVGRHPQPPWATRVPRSSRVVHADPGHPTIVSPRADSGSGGGRVLARARAPNVHPTGVPGPSRSRGRWRRARPNRSAHLWPIRYAPQACRPRSARPQWSAHSTRYRHKGCRSARGLRSGRFSCRPPSG